MKPGELDVPSLIGTIEEEESLQVEDDIPSKDEDRSQ